MRHGVVIFTGNRQARTRFFPVPSLADAREQASGLGGSLEPGEKEWSWRGFRASEGLDPDGNVIQFREAIS